MSPTPPWRPVLEGDSAAAALATVDEIAAATALGTEGGAFLAGGAAGAAILEAWLAVRAPGQGHEDAAVALLDRAIEAVAEQPMTAALYAGFTGIAWTAELLTGRLLAPGDEDGNEAIDEALAMRLEQTPWRDDYDLVSGLAGFAVYAIERLPVPSARRCLALVVDRLAETAERRGAACTWKTAPELLLPTAREQHPDGYYNLGLAHGVPALVPVLATAVAHGVATERARPLLDGARAWLRAEARLDGDGSVFGYYSAQHDAPATRSAWCYGDPGVGLALLSAGVLLDEPAEIEHARRILLRAAARPIAECGVRDAGLCHGAAGLGLIYQRAFQLAGDTAFADASRAWFLRTLELRRPGVGVAGYQALGPKDASGELDWLDDPGLLTGAAGVGLALLSAATAIAPDWDRFLLCSVRPVP